jgi:hypothetical protein
MLLVLHRLASVGGSQCPVARFEPVAFGKGGRDLTLEWNAAALRLALNGVARRPVLSGAAAAGQEVVRRAAASNGERADR